MSREVDIIVFGATGFTGKHAVPIVNDLAKKRNRSLTWGIAGRSQDKLKEVLAECEKETGTSLSDIPVYVADVKDDKSLNAMASKARIIINCCGPYRFYGEQVVKACVAQGTHHVDVSGEPQYMEGMQLKYHKEAQEKGIYIVSACGFDSIPSDMGVVFLQDKFDGTLNAVTTYLKSWQTGDGCSGPSVNYGTWESAVYGLAHADELKHLRKQLYPDRLPSFKPKLQSRVIPHQTDVEDGWVLPFLGSDRSVVRRSQRHFYEADKKRPVQVETYFVVNSFIYVILMALMGGIFGILARFSFGRSLLLSYPEFFSFGQFSRKPPSEEKIKNTWFSITLKGEGWQERLAGPDDVYTTPMDKQIIGKVQGANPGYGATCVALVLAAVVILTESDKLPNKGGVYPPGAAFAKTSIIEQLNENGVTFEILKEKDI